MINGCQQQLLLRACRGAFRHGLRRFSMFLAGDLSGQRPTEVIWSQAGGWFRISRNFAHFLHILRNFAYFGGFLRSFA